MRFIFMMYVGRSGSTMLAHALERRSANLTVLPEFRLPEYLLAEGEENVSSMGHEQLLELIDKDLQTHKFSFSESVWENIARRSEGQGIRFIIEEVARCYASTRNKKPEFVMIKLGQLLLLWPDIERLFPGSKYLHVLRDPRGAANSMLRTKRVYYHGGDMGRGDIVYVAKYWSGYVRQVREVSEHVGDRLSVIRYEDLCRDEESTVLGFLTDSGISVADAAGESQDAQSLGRESALHPNIGSSALQARALAWKEELPAWQGIALETRVRDCMAREEYSLWYIERSSPLQIGLARARANIRHLLTQVVFFGRRAWFYIAAPKLFVQHLKLYIARRRARHAAGHLHDTRKS